MKATKNPPSRDCILVFSSAFRPLYRQNVLDTLAAAPGTNRQFRYRVDLLGPGCNPIEFDEFNKTTPPAMMFFSIQDEAEFQDAAFIPIRIGNVVNTRKAGTFRFISVAVTGYVSFEGAAGGPPQSSSVRKLVKYLTDHYPGHYPNIKYASRATSFLDHLGDASLTRQADDDVELFVRTAKYLNATPAYRDASFIRVLGLADAKSKAEVNPDLTTGVFTLEGGKEYELVLFHYRPGNMTEAIPFSIGVDLAYISVIGGLTFAAASAYDRIPVRFYVSDPGPKGATSTVLSVRAADSAVLAPVLTLTISIKPAKNIRGMIAASLFMIVTSLVAWFSTGSLPWEAKAAGIVLTPILLFGVYYRANLRIALPAQ